VKYLLDTCTAVWGSTGTDHLSDEALAVFENEDVPLVVSAVTVWEVSVKTAKGAPGMPASLDDFMRRMRDELEVEWLPIDEIATSMVGRLPPIHRDPFDRLLVAQAVEHGLTILTPDRMIARYPAAVLW
jgi:PIN domain nuclease of toxin-antitoxin system